MEAPRRESSSSPIDDALWQNRIYLCTVQFHNRHVYAINHMDKVQTSSDATIAAVEALPTLHPTHDNLERKWYYHLPEKPVLWQETNSKQSTYLRDWGILFEACFCSRVVSRTRAADNTAVAVGFRFACFTIAPSTYLSIHPSIRIGTANIYLINFMALRPCPSPHRCW